MTMHNLATRFMKCVEPVTESGCWIWTKAVNEQGYGRIGVGTKIKRAHRVAWEIFNGAIPSEKFVLHHCDVTGCVNPAHLWLGDQKANMVDKIEKGREAKGSRNGNAKLTEAEVVSIRESDGKQKEIAKSFGVSLITVSRIKRRRTWIRS